MRTSIAILGGGPAGSAAALTLQRYLPDFSVTLLAAPPVGQDAPAVGETLSPGVLPLLRYLGIHQEFLKLEQLAVGETSSAWGSEQVFERTYLFTGQGQGWHLDRARFDAWLLSCAEDAGVRCIRSRVVRASPAEGCWRIELQDGCDVLADAVIDATGRSAWFARRQGRPPRRDDGLVADARWFHYERQDADARGALVESIQDGWWYSAALPGHRGVAMFMTDADLRGRRTWAERLADAPNTSSRLAAWHPTGDAAVRPANSQCSEILVGERWLAAGDAAIAFDPISALGIGFSLRSGMEAARVAVAAIENDCAFAAEYGASVVRIYNDYRARLSGIYRLERRWQEDLFWDRRRTQGCAPFV